MHSGLSELLVSELLLILWKFKIVTKIICHQKLIRGCSTPYEFLMSLDNNALHGNKITSPILEGDNWGLPRIWCYSLFLAAVL